jgi:hypothetical protein
VGPVNIAGRVTTLIAHPADPLRLWAGAAAGGVWCSVDGGKNWQTTWPKWASPNIGALAFDAFDPKVIYCASGEANISPDCYPGSGVYVSRDEGATWEVLATADDNVLPRRIGALVSSPHTPGLLYLGGVNLDETQAGGLYHSNDGGKLWLRENSISVHNYWCHSIALHPDGAVFAALEMNGRQTGIYRRDGGDDTLWTQLHGGLPPGDKRSWVSTGAGTAATGGPKSAAPNSPPKNRAVTTMRLPCIPRKRTRWSADSTTFTLPAIAARRGRAPATGMPMRARRNMCTAISTRFCCPATN